MIEDLSNENVSLTSGESKGVNRLMAAVNLSKSYVNLLQNDDKIEDDKNES